MHWVLHLESFKAWEFRGGLKGRSQQNVHRLFQVYPFRIMIYTDWPALGQEAISHHSWPWHHLPGFAAFLGLDLMCN